MKNIVLQGFRYITEDDNSGDVMEIRNITGRSSGGWSSTVEYETVYTINLSEETSSLNNNELNIDIDTGAEICMYALDSTLENPAIILILRKIWEPA